MSELKDVYEVLKREADPDYVPEAELDRVAQLARGAGYIASVLHGRLALDFHVGKTQPNVGPHWDPHTAFIPTDVGWRLRKGRGMASDRLLGGLETPVTKVTMLTEDGRVLHVTYDPVVTETARDMASIRRIPASEVAITTDAVDMLAPDADLDAVFMFNEHAQRIPYGIRELTYNLARFALRHKVPAGM